MRSVDARQVRGRDGRTKVVRRGISSRVLAPMYLAYVHGVMEVGSRSGGSIRGGERGGSGCVLKRAQVVLCLLCGCTRARGAQSAEEVEQHRVDRALVGHLAGVGQRGSGGGGG